MAETCHPNALVTFEEPCDPYSSHRMEALAQIHTIVLPAKKEMKRRDERKR
jgi:hypothetical protein